MSPLRRALAWLEARLPKTTITVGGKPYLTRCYLFGKDRAWGNVYLHHFHSSDQGEELHNHPWAWGISLVLAGGYSEEYRDDWDGKEGWHVARRTVRPRTLHLIRASDFHRVDLLDGEAWTLFFAGPRTKDWGFWDRRTQRFKDWRENPEAIP